MQPVPGFRRPSSAITEDVGVKRIPFLSLRVDVEALADSFARSFAESISLILRHAHDTQHCVCQGLKTLWRNHDACIADKFANSAHVGGNHRFLHGHRFADDERHAFPRGAEDEGIRGIEKRRHIIAQPEPMNSVRNPNALCKVLHALPFRCICISGYPKLRLPRCGTDTGKRSKQIRVILGGHDTASSQPYEIVDCIQLASRGYASLRSGRKFGKINSIGDNGTLALRHSAKFHKPMRHGIADGGGMDSETIRQAV